ncbi:hypothetical protein [Pseudaminobacter soli (ex Li et al. 2025)]|uniref:Uncharacterized protein n=1 Tax=Pseudaminobacter soli (ex Li et al. 2025) TaxID=1295366 RepID=A0A2P7S025_9HYPH|nr:hypothetical protein [Mesorhizobium soli]PSJ55811.1 hypothetical protein C7I85_26360 [Mesorhizobium soli]
MAYLNPRVLDLGLNVLVTETTRLHYCSDEPTTYAQAVSLSLGSKASPTIGAPVDRTPSGRKVTVAAVANGAATGAGSITHYALVDATNSRLLATRETAAAKAVATGDTITSAAFDVGIPGAGGA